MWIKISLFLTASLALLVPSRMLALESCDSSVEGARIAITTTNNIIKITATEMARSGSDLKEDFVKALYEAESAATVEILRFIESKVEEIENKGFEINGKYFPELRRYHPVEISEPPELGELLKQMVVVSQCRVNREFVQVKVELSSKRSGL